MLLDNTHWRRFAKTHRTIKREQSGAELIYAGSYMHVWINRKNKSLDNNMGEVTMSILSNNNRWTLVEDRPLR